jgi:hypothetical protein
MKIDKTSLLNICLNNEIWQNRTVVEMVAVQKHHDDLLRSQLEALTEADKDYWSFKGNSRRECGHGMFQYPAMMVPQIAKTILEQACAVHPDIENVGDPFVGSGTIMTESMMHGLSFYGVDINPLAILLCRVKKGPFYINALKDKTMLLNSRIDGDGQDSIEVNFHNKDKWFTRDVQVSMSKIRRAIRKEGALWARRFFWVALAEAVRLTSNSRTSTFKLHTRTQQDIVDRVCDPIGMFKRALFRNIHHYEEQARTLSCSGQLARGHYKREVKISLADVRNAQELSNLDIIITSPPYGDNATTVPYGQYSYLPLQWIDLDDVERGLDTKYLDSTHEIDFRSLGGSRRLEKEELESLQDRSSAFKNYVQTLNDQPRDRIIRVAAFFRDLDNSLDPILKSLRPGGLMVWTLGNRKVGGKRVPLDCVLTELLQLQQAAMLCKLTRRISSKRMAFKNNIAETMSNETILVMRKAI